jgi:hypothetical protein
MAASLSQTAYLQSIWPKQKMDTSRTVAWVASTVAVVAAGLTLVYAAWDVSRKGFQISKSKRLTGRPAWILATILALLGVAVGVGGALYLPSYLGFK